MSKRKPTKHEDDVLRNLRQPDRYDPQARSFGGPWRMVKCKDGSYVCYEQHLEIIDNLRKNAEINDAQSPHDGIHTCSKGCKKPGCNRGLRDTIEEQDAQIVALKQDLLERAADHRKTCRRRIHDLNLIQSLKEDIESLTGQVRQFEEHRDIAAQIIKRLEAEARSQFANSEWQPIETAPKDATLIIGWSKEYTNPFIVLWTCLHQWDDPKDVFGWVEAEGDWSTGIELTHWTHLPKPPTK